MDTITAFTKTIHPDITVSKFMVCGESKVRLYVSIMISNPE